MGSQIHGGGDIGLEGRIYIMSFEGGKDTPEDQIHEQNVRDGKA